MIPGLLSRMLVSRLSLFVFIWIAWSQIPLQALANSPPPAQPPEKQLQLNIIALDLSAQSSDIEQLREIAATAKGQLHTAYDMEAITRETLAAVNVDPPSRARGWKLFPKGNAAMLLLVISLAVLTAAVTVTVIALQQKKPRTINVIATNLRGGSQQFIPQRSPFLIGRSPNCDVVLADDTNKVSREHCQVTLTSGGFVVEDLGSANGTLVAGSTIAGRQLLSPMDDFSIGDYKLRVVLR
jgi:hypothetical protein